MKILFLTFYYPPDLCAGSFRSHALIRAIQKKNKNIKIDVLTTMPNRYTSHNKKLKNLKYIEDNNNLTIYRIKLPLHKSGMFDQAISFIIYFIQVLKIIRKNDYDIVFASSSRLMTAFLGSVISRVKNVSLYLDIRDLFSDTLKDLLSPKINFFLMPIIKLIEYISFIRASKINIVSKGFKTHVESISNNNNTSFYTNGIDEIFLKNNNFTPKKNNFKNLPIILYAGNIGEGQGLHNIIGQVAKLMENKIQFIILGDGGAKNKLINSLAKHSIKNVKIINPVPQINLIDYYNNADILFLHLNAYKAFEKVLPSKIFEYCATNKPILAGVNGFASKFIKKEVQNSFVFAPCDEKEMIKKIKIILSNPINIERKTFIKKYNRVKIMEEMATEVLSFTKGINKYDKF